MIVNQCALRPFIVMTLKLVVTVAEELKRQKRGGGLLLNAHFVVYNASLRTNYIDLSIFYLV
jgi:hypothetical protein